MSDSTIFLGRREILLIDLNTYRPDIENAVEFVFTQPSSSFCFQMGVAGEKEIGTIKMGFADNPNSPSFVTQALCIQPNGKVSVFGEPVGEDPFVYAAFRYWVCKGVLLGGWGREDDLTCLVNLDGGAEICFCDSEQHLYLSFAHEGNDIVAVIDNKIKTKDPARIYEAFVGWLRAAVVAM